MLRISAKTGEGVADALDAIVERVPAPAGDPDAPPRALIFDSSYDQYRGVVVFVRVIDGTFAKGESSRDGGRHEFEAEELGFLRRRWCRRRRSPRARSATSSRASRTSRTLRIGDTLTSRRNPAGEPLPGYKDVKPMVFAGLFPTDADEYEELRDALDKLKLNDGALFYEPETSQALGFGFRCGFLGLLHMEIVRERLEREFDLDLLVTAPNVAYRVEKRTGEEIEVHNPSEMPRELERVEEPYVRASIIVPKDYVGPVMELSNERRGQFDHMEYLSEERVMLVYDLPLGEIVLDYYDQLKSRTRGYAELRLRLRRLREAELVRVDMLIAGEPVDALSLISHRDSRVLARRARLSTVCARRSRATCSRSPSRPRSARGWSRARRSRRGGRTCSRSATAATSHASASSWRSRRRGRSG